MGEKKKKGCDKRRRNREGKGKEVEKGEGKGERERQRVWGMINTKREERQE